MITKIIHRWLVSGNKKFRRKKLCLHCHQQEKSTIDHDYFLALSTSSNQKLRPQKFDKLLQQFTPLSLYKYQSFEDYKVISTPKLSQFKSLLLLQLNANKK